MEFSHASRARLTTHDLDRFAGTTVFDRIGRAVCEAGCLPRKELYEAWEVARRARRLFRGGRVVDLGGGHGLLAQIMLVLDDSSPEAIVVDKRVPPCAHALNDEMVAAWPRLEDRFMWIADDLARVPIDAGDVVVASHACGRLTDVVIECAAAATIGPRAMRQGSRAGWITRWPSTRRAPLHCAGAVTACGRRRFPRRSLRRTGCCWRRLPVEGCYDLRSLDVFGDYDSFD